MRDNIEMSSTSDAFPIKPAFEDKELQRALEAILPVTYIMVLRFKVPKETGCLAQWQAFPCLEGKDL